MPDEAILEPPKGKQPARLYNAGQGRESNIPWEAVRSAVESGVSMVKVAKRWAELHPKGYKGLLEVIKKRSIRKGWVVPRTLIGEARERAAELGVDVPAMSKSCTTTPSDRAEVGTFLVQSLQEGGEEGSKIALDLALGLLRNAHANRDKLAPIVDSKDVMTNLRTVRLSAGMDKQASPVQFNLWGSPAHVPAHVPVPHGDIIDCPDE